jgi:glutathione S-transferase
MRITYGRDSARGTSTIARKSGYIPRPMLLIGQYDSPFVRRVAIALTLYELPYEHKPWSVWADADALARYNPLRRVPTLVLDDGTALFESSAILDYLDDSVGLERALLPRTGFARREGLRICALATRRLRAALLERGSSEAFRRKHRAATSGPRGHVRSIA